MPRSGSRPEGVPRPSRSRRPGRAGVGPGPAYRPTSTGGGTKHRPVPAAKEGCVVLALLMIGLPLAAVAFIAERVL